MDNLNEFVKMFLESSSVMELAQKMGYQMNYSKSRFSGTVYRLIKRKCKDAGLEYKKLTGRSVREEHDDVLKRIVPQSKSIREVLGKLGLDQDNGTVFQRIYNRIKFLGIDTSHFSGQQWNKGQTRITNKSLDMQAMTQETPWKQAFAKGSKIKNENLMKRLVCSGKMEYKCSKCGINHWNGEPIRLRLDHIDGDSTNNCEGNLRFLCPNCDSQTETFCRGTRKRGKGKTWWHILATQHTSCTS